MTATLALPGKASLGNGKPRCARCRKVLKPERCTKRFCSTTCRVASHRAAKRELARHDWHSPPEVVEAARLVLGGIDLDPASCAKANETVKATAFYAPPQDGLRLPWRARTLYMNPPYGRHVDAWVARLVEQHQQGSVAEAVALLPARPDTRWFARLDGYPRCHVRGRLRFNGAGTGAPFPSCVVYLGPAVERFDGVFGAFGPVWERRP